MLLQSASKVTGILIKACCLTGTFLFCGEKWEDLFLQTSEFAFISKRFWPLTSFWAQQPGSAWEVWYVSLGLRVGLLGLSFTQTSRDPDTSLYFLLVTFHMQTSTHLKEEEMNPSTTEHMEWKHM